MQTRIASFVDKSIMRILPLVIGLCLTVVGLVGCGSGQGSMYVSFPQVNTRERLVTERNRERQWLEKQLDESDKIESTFHGLRDFREFVGLYNELTASFKPVQGEGDQQAKETPSQAAEAPASAQPADGAASKDTSESSDASAPFGRSPEDVTLPDPGAIKKADLKEHPLDLLRDKMAYRNAVNAAIKTNQLDDSHDFTGQMLYELTLFVTLSPGDGNRRFAKVELELQPPKFDADRVREMVRLYDNWKQAMEADIASEVRKRQSQINEGQTLTEDDRRYLLDLINIYGPAVLARMQSENGLEKIKSYTDADAVELEKVLVALDDVRTDEQLKNLFEKEPDPKKLANLRRAVGWAIWGYYDLQLEYIVKINPPKFDDNGGRLIGGLDLEDYVPLQIREIPKDIAGDVEQDNEYWEDNCIIIKSLEGFRCNKYKPTLSERDTGVVSFIRRLRRVEKNPHALTVNPLEHAQNISEASARETMLNMIVALNAMLPSSGVSAKNQTQFVRRAQTYLHAITRQPLLVGYGDGEKKFGWFLGPAFTVEKGKAKFVQRLIRHDVSAGIVIPAWRNTVDLKGTQYWVDGGGNAIKDGSLWEGKTITLAVRMPADASQQITRALLPHAIVSEPYVYSVRPQPEIEYPNERDALSVQSVRPGEERPLPQEVLVLGKNLWRNPQVFIGSQMADSVDVLSNMEGVLARFNRVVYPGPLTGPLTEMPVDLTVVSSFGQDRQKGAVRVLWPADLPAPELDTPPFLAQSASAKFEADDPSKLETPLELVLRLDKAGPHFKLRLQLDNAATNGKMLVNVIIADTRYGEKDKLANLPFTKQGEALVVRISEITDAAMRQKLLDWSATGGVVLVHMEVANVGEVLVKNQTGADAAKIVFTK